MGGFHDWPDRAAARRLIGYRIDGRIYDPDDVEVVYEAADDEATPPDLDHAIQAAAGALQLIYDWEDEEGG